MDEYKVYFDYIYNEVTNQVTMGVYVLDPDNDPVSTLIKKTVKGKGPQNKYNLDYSLMAMDYAIGICYDYGLESIEFYNQNKLIFEWVTNINKLDRMDVNKVRQRLAEYLNADGLEVDMSYNVAIKGKDNLAKKELNKTKKVQKKKTQKTKGTLNNLKELNKGTKSSKTEVFTKKSTIDDIYDDLVINCNTKK